MALDMKKNKRKPWPWHRKKYGSRYVDITSTRRVGRFELKYMRQKKKTLRFRDCLYDNNHLDFCTKKAAIKASRSVVSIVTVFGDEKIFQGSGTIIETDGTILTSAKVIGNLTDKDLIDEKFKVVVYLSRKRSFDAKVIAYNRHFNIATAKIDVSDRTLSKACLRLIDDCISLQLSELDDDAVRPRSNSFHLIPGEKVVVLGRFPEKPYDLMAAPGEFCLDRCSREIDCRELFMANCLIPSLGEGGPLINRYGEVIGIAFHDIPNTPFIPINVAWKWWEHYKKNGIQDKQPVLGMELTNLYATDIDIMEKVILKFHKFAGVIVEEVIQGSSAYSAGMRPNDVIVECSGKTVRSFLELFDIMWDYIGKSVELVVIRASNEGPLRFTIVC